MKYKHIIGKYFEKLKQAHEVYVKVSFEKQGKILVAFDWIFKELEQLGVDRGFSETLLISGKEFVDTLRPVSLPVSSRTDQPVSQEATLADAERIFGSKAENLTSKEKRQHALASKYNALVYKPLKAKGDGVKVEVLLEKKSSS